MSNIHYPIIFTHVPRTGGTTLNKIFKNNFSTHDQFEFEINHNGTAQDSLVLFDKMTAEDKERFLFLNGHINFGIHKYYNQSCTYTTLFRNPINRILSYYHLILIESKHFLHKTIIKNRINLTDLLTSKISIEFNNAQVRQLSGETGKCNEFTLEKAIENLEKFYPVFGLTERYDESLVLLSKYFNFLPPYYVLLNKGKNQNTFKVTEKIKQTIYETNQLDIKFYEYAVKKFQKLVDLQGSDFNNDVDKFKKINNFLRKIEIGDLPIGINCWNSYIKYKSKLKRKNI